jgi:enoyl-CoA hydratase
LGDAVRLERRGAVATLVLDRPTRRNAVDRATAEALVEAVREAEADPQVVALVLWGAGGTFCAGADLKAFAEGSGNRVEAEGDGPMGPTRMLASKPVIAAVEGHAVAGGLELAAWCDLRVAAEDAVFGVFCRRFGVPLIDGGTVRLPALVGLGRAMDMILTGRPVPAPEAHAWGLVNRLVPPGEARAAAEALAAELAALPQDCLRADRASVYAALGRPLEEALAVEFRTGARLVAGAEARDGVAQFVAGAGRHGTFPGDEPPRTSDED